MLLSLRIPTHLSLPFDIAIFLAIRALYAPKEPKT